MPCKYTTAKEVIERYQSFLLGLPLVIKGMQYKINHLIISSPKELKNTFLAYRQNNYDNEKALKLATPEANEFNVYVVHYNPEKNNLLYSELGLYLNHACIEGSTGLKTNSVSEPVTMGIKRISADLMYLPHANPSKSISA